MGALLLHVQAYQDWVKKPLILLRIPQMQLTPPLLDLAVKAALATDLAYIRGLRMKRYGGVDFAPQIPTTASAVRYMLILLLTVCLNSVCNAQRQLIGSQEWKYQENLK